MIKARHLLPVIFLTISRSFTLAQVNDLVDSLKREILNTANSEIKAELHNQISKDLVYKDVDQALKHTDTLMLLGQSLKNDDLIMQANYNYSVLYRIKGDYDKALTIQQRYVDYIEKKGDTLEMAMAYYQLGAIHVRLDHNEEASEKLQKALLYAEKVENNSLIFKILNALGVIYKNILQPDKALEYYTRAIDYCILEKDTASLAIIYNGIGVLYTKMDSSDKALEYFREALTIAERSGNIAAVGHQNRNIGTIMFDLGDYPSAEMYHKKALDLRIKLNSSLQIGGSYSDLGEVYLATDRLTEAEEYFNSALSIFKEIKSISSENHIYDQLARLHAKRKNFERSNFYLKKFFTIRDSLQNNELKEKINELDIKYQTAKKDLELGEQELTLTKRTSQRNLIMAGAGILLILTWFLFYRNRKNKILSGAKIENLEKRQKLMALDYMVQGQEHERKRIAQDLHDGLGGLLASARLQMQKIQREITRFDKMTLFDQAEKMIDHAHTEVRRIAHDMMPGALIDLGLIDAINDLIDEIAHDHGLVFNFSKPAEDPVFSEPQSINLYRIVQEILNNTVKHAQASTVEISLQIEKYNLILKISDDGQGFDYEKAQKSEGLGLNNILSRVQYLGGTIQVKAGEGEGTLYRLDIPLTPTKGR